MRMMSLVGCSVGRVGGVVEEAGVVVSTEELDEANLASDVVQIGMG